MPELQPPPPPAGAIAIAPPPPPPSGAVAIGAPTFTSNLTDTLVGAPAGIIHTVTNPRESLKAWRDQSQALHDAATDAVDRGDYEAAAVHGINFLANIVPGLGNAMDKAASAKTPEEFKAELGNVVGAALLMKAPEMIKAGAGAAATGAKAVVTTAADAASKLRDAASHPAAGAVVDAVSMVHPGFAHAVNLIKRGSKVADALHKSFGATDGTAAEPARPIGPPAAWPAEEMRTPQFEDVPDVERTAGPEAPPTAGPARTSRPVGAPQPFTPNSMRTPQFDDMPDVPRRTNIPAEPAAAPATGPDAIRDGIAQGFKYKNFAAIKDANVAATVQRLADQQAEREGGATPAPAAKPPAAAPPPPPAGAVPIAAEPATAAIPRAETLKPDVAKTLQEGAVRENPDGSRQVLQRVPLDKIASDPGNEIYPDVVGSYQRNGYSVHPELRANEEGGLTVQEGHHRLAADAKNGKTDVLAWAPEADRPAPRPEAQGPFFHGSSEADLKFKPGIIHMAPDEANARAFGENVHGVKAAPGSAKDVSAAVNDAIAQDGDPDQVLNAEADKARAEGHRYITFDHPNVDGAKENFKATVALYPDKDLSINKPATVLQTIDQGIARRRMPGMNYQDVDAYLASKRPQPPPGEPGESASPAATPPPPAAPAAPAAAAPPKPYGKQYITPGQVAKYAAENGLGEDDAAAALEKQGVSVVDRASTNRVLHAIGAELGYNHATLSEIAHATYGTGLGKMTHEQMMELAEKLGNEQATNEPLATKRTGSPANPAIAPQPEGSPLGGVVQQLPTGEIHADPVRFQYKAGMGQGGAGDELRGVTKFDPEKSGILSVWKDPADGKTYVVNGHHRLELAQRTGAENLTVRYIDAANAAEARAKGAMINIAEGRGTSIDAAKVFRDSGASAEDLQNQGLSLTGSVAKEGQALANLDPNLFNQVVSGEMKPARGAMIGQVAEHADQRQLVKLIHEREASGKPMTDGQVSEMLRMQAPQVTETQHSLFGDDEVSRSLIAEKAGVSDYIQSRLTQKRRTFNAVGNERAATRLAEAGNVIDADKNAAIAEATNQEHAVYQKLSTSTGPVADALDEAAKALHAGENPAIVKVRTYAKIEPILKREADKLTGRSGAPGERPEGSAQPGSREAGRGKQDRGAEEAPAKVSDLMR